MKNRILFTIAVLAAVCFSFQQLSGQEKSQEQKEKDAKLQQAIELQKKQMMEQLRMLGYVE